MATAPQVGWLVASTLPETTRGPYVSRLDPYLPYLFQRWESGYHNMAALFRELVDRGYKGSYESVRDHLVRQLPELPPAVGEVVLTALAKDPKERFATIQAFATALEQSCQAAPAAKPIALISENTFPSQSLQFDDASTATPSSQVSQPSATEPASPIPTGELSAKPLEGSSSLSERTE